MHFVCPLPFLSVYSVVIWGTTRCGSIIHLESDPPASLLSGFILSSWSLLGHPPEDRISSGFIAAKIRHDRHVVRTFLSVCVSTLLNGRKHISRRSPKSVAMSP